MSARLIFLSKTMAVSIDSDREDSMTTQEQLVAVLAAAGPAHHAAYIDTNGDDPEWPLWYAKHVIEDVRRILELPGLTVSRLVWAFVDADRTHRADAPEVSWSRYYADRFIAEL